jgi:hypothetical protein
LGGVLAFFFKTIWKFVTLLFEWLVNIFSKKEPYEIYNLRKHVTICKDGHLIILQDFKLKINNPESIEKFYRHIDVSDAAKKCKLKNMAGMQNVSKDKRFKEHGFWYKTNPSNIVEKIKEEGSHSKRLEFYFRFNKEELKKYNNFFKRKLVNIMYGFSIKNGQPLTNGKFDYSLIEDQERQALIITGFKVKYKVKSIEYIVGLIDTIKIEEDDINMWYYPNGQNDSNTKEKIEFEKKDDLFYNKFCFTLKNPKLNSTIIIEIPLKEITNSSFLTQTYRLSL